MREFRAGWFSDGETAVALVQRCASSSIRDSVKRFYREVTPSDALNARNRMCWVREPFNRLVSAFSFFHYSVAGLPGSITGNWETFVDHTLNERDHHWEPQWDMLCYNGVFIPSKVFLFEDLQRTWPFPGLLPWIRGVRHVSVDETYRRDEIDEKYQRDLELYQDAKRS